MRLSYSIPKKLWLITDFLDYESYKGIHNAIIKERNKINLNTVKGAWSNGLINNLVPPLRTEVSKYQPFEHLKTLITNNIYLQISNITQISTIIHFMKKGAGINWHSDDTWRYGATYYLNHKWHRQWGGEFMFTDEEGHGWIPPVGNSLVILKSPMAHKVNPVLSPLMPRISVQVFIK
jgi:Rps23 Pro-64 3,4-dihydroxylase Tpa1-like proline 4-hydroxylase|tara:strand:+ start:980 stop:1513 length:534 start_codon:yes stop_codon:yes gene_type:complete